MLPGEEVEELDELAPAEAAEELVERMLQYARFRGAGGTWPRHAYGKAFLYRSVPPPPGGRKVSAAGAEQAYDPAVLGASLGALLRVPAPIDLTPLATARVTGRRAPADPARPPAPRPLQLRRSRQGRRPRHGLRDRVGTAGALQAWRGRLGAGRALRPDHGHRRRPAASRGVNLSAHLEALLFLAPDPVSVEELADALQVGEEAVNQAAKELEADLDSRGLVVRRIARRPRARLAPGRRGGRPPPARPPAHARAHPRPGGDARDRRLPAAGEAGLRSPASVASPRSPRPRRAGRARPDRGGGALAVRRGPLSHDREPPQALRAGLAGGVAGHRAVGPLARGGRRAQGSPAPHG